MSENGENGMWEGGIPVSKSLGITRNSAMAADATMGYSSSAQNGSAVVAVPDGPGHFVEDRVIDSRSSHTGAELVLRQAPTPNSKMRRGKDANSVIPWVTPTIVIISWEKLLG